MNYLNFINDGISQGRKPELVGGGLKRSLGGTLPREREPVDAYDERVLGSGLFVEQLRQERELKVNLLSGMELPELMGRIGRYYGLAPDELGRRCRSKQVMEVRDVFCYIAVRILLHRGTEAGQFLHLKRSAVSHAVRRGNEIILGSPDLVGKILLSPC